MTRIQQRTTDYSDDMGEGETSHPLPKQMRKHFFLCNSVLSKKDPLLILIRYCFICYSVFQGFIKAKSANGGSILSSSQFLILPQLPQQIKLASKVVKVDSKIIILLPKI
jgi:hypothetical protein